MSDTTHCCPHCGKPILSPRARAAYEYARRDAPKRGGYMWEGARQAYEAGTYQDADLTEMLAAGVIVPHQDPKKGWIIK